MLDIQETTIEEQITGTAILQERIYVLMRWQGDFLCARSTRHHTAAWDRSISLALQGKTLAQLQSRIKALTSQIERARRCRPKLEMNPFPNLEGAALYAAHLSLEPPTKTALPIEIPNIRRDFIRPICNGEGPDLCFIGRSTKGKLATRPSKAIGFATIEQAGSMALQRVIRLICLEC